MDASPLFPTSYYLWLLLSLPLDSWAVCLDLLIEEWRSRSWKQGKKPWVLRFNLIGPDAEDRDLEEYKGSKSAPGVMKIPLVVIGVASTSKPGRSREGGLCLACPPPCPAPANPHISQRGGNAVHRLRERTWQGFAGRNEEKLGVTFGAQTPLNNGWVTASRTRYLCTLSTMELHPSTHRHTPQNPELGGPSWFK